MKLSKLLAARQLINDRANLANLAYAFLTLKRFGDRIARAGLHGRVRLAQPLPDEEPYWATLTALEGSQAVIDEHFDEEDLMSFADAVAFALEGDYAAITFPIEETAERFVAPLRFLLSRAGVTVDLDDELAGHAG